MKLDSVSSLSFVSDRDCSLIMNGRYVSVMRNSSIVVFGCAEQVFGRYLTCVENFGIKQKIEFSRVG